MTPVRVEPVERDEWLCLSAQFQDHNYRQCWDYGQLLAKRRNAKSHHMCIRRGEEVLGLADVRIKRAPLLGGIAYIGGGPIVRKGDGGDIDRLATCLKALRGYCIESEGLVLRIQGTLGDQDWIRGSTDCYVDNGFKGSASGREYRTFVVDLTRPLADIRSKLAQKWRNCLNKAERMNPSAKITAAIGDFDRFAVLFEQFVQRKGFATDLDARFFRQLQEHLPPAESMTLSLVEVDGALVAGHLSTMLGDTCVYLLGATSDEGLKTNAAYLLQWYVIKMAWEKGLKWYDLGGIDPVGNPGVYHFKCGLGGDEMRAPGPFELAPSAISARLFSYAERTYRRLRQHRKSSRPTRSIAQAKSASRSSPAT